MIQSIYIRDFILIEELHCTLPSGLIAVTGETGAGKSIFVNALQLLVGGRVDLSTIRQGSARAIIEATFEDLSPAAIACLEREGLLDETPTPASCILRREINRTGRSRIFVNDSPISLTLLEELGPLLIDVHSQHRNLLLRDGIYQTSLVDSQLGENSRLLEEYLAAYRRYRDSALTLKKLRDEAQQAAALHEIHSRDYAEIAALGLEHLSLETLESEARQLSYAQDISEGIRGALSVLSGAEHISARLTQATHQLMRITDYLPSLTPSCERLESLALELEDIEQELNNQLDQLSDDPDRLDEVQHLISGINAQLKKHNLLSADELIEYGQQLRATLEQSERYDSQLHTLREEVLSQRREVIRLGEALSGARHIAADTLSRRITDMLVHLEMPHAQFAVVITPLEKPSQWGLDQVQFLLSANANQPLRPVSEVASGGEIARLMLSLKALRATTPDLREPLPTLVLDEIDAGTSGVAASRIADMLRQMGHACQLIVITHLPQIAATAPDHLLIYKVQGDQTLSHLRLLTPSERPNEIARLQSGDQITPEALAAAQQLLTAYD